ncbi:phosphopantetheine-binding protein [Bacillus subtilis subsp. subtilis]
MTSPSTGPWSACLPSARSTYWVSSSIVGCWKRSFISSFQPCWDRKALPEPDIEAGSGEYKAPTTDMEELLAGIWQDVLGMSEVGVTDNFFSLGGDSIKGIQMASRLNTLPFAVTGSSFSVIQNAGIM